MNSKKAKKIATWIIIPLMASIFILDIVTVVAGNILAKRYMPSPENGSPRYSDDRIHFLNTANSDCILLESNGHFALVDSGEGDSNPRRKTAYHGYEEQVLAYLKSAAVSSDGKVRLDFILGTHYHYDHVGCFDRIINDDDIIIKKAYFKKHNPEIDHDYEIEKWRLGDIYETIVNDLKKKNIPLEQNIPDKIKFGDFELTLYNTGYYGEKSAFLAADITKTSGLEKKLGEIIGHCDLLKAGHHGYYGSSSMSFLKYIKPEVTIIPNMQGKVYPNVKWNLTMFAHTPFYGTYDYNGIIASFTDDGRIILTNDIHREEL